MKFLIAIFNILIIISLTIVTQIGGIIWCLNLLIFYVLKKKVKRRHRILSFSALYLTGTFLIIPFLAFQFGRVPLPITKSGIVAPHTYLTVFLNRNYTSPNLKSELIDISSQFALKNPNIKTIYLDANFPFWDGFPLLPHLSHNDGKKVDLSFNYTRNGIATNQKPARSGYGYYEPPKKGESNHPDICAKKGNWKYSLSQYLTLGSSNKLAFDKLKTKELLQLILKRQQTHKVFIEPHLKQRLKINHAKLRYHGCQATRHDDHIHYQIR
jgi:hypothetical protein